MSTVESSSAIIVQDYYDNNKHYALEIDPKTERYSFKELAWRGAVQGFGKILVFDGVSTLAAYFSREKPLPAEALNYGSSMFFAIDNSLYDVRDGSSRIRWRMGLLNRSFTIQSRGGETAHTYRWPLSRQFVARTLGDPFNFVSNDFLEEFVKVVRHYHPEVAPLV